MKIKIALILTLVSFASMAQTNGDLDDVGEDLSVMLGYNSIGKGFSLSNFIPEIFFGWNEEIKIREKLKWRIKVGPYTSSQIDVKDSTSFLPALMMQGNAGLVLNNFFSFKLSESHRLYFSPANFGLKLLSNFTDSTKTLIQHNIRPAFGYEFKDRLMVSFQYTLGWHNITSAGEENFEKIFKKKATDVQYINVSLQTRISKPEGSGGTYLLIAWRSFVNHTDFEGTPNRKILTFGIRKSIDFSQGTPSFF